jgi:hypothetical protein
MVGGIVNDCRLLRGFAEDLAGDLIGEEVEQGVDAGHAKSSDPQPAKRRTSSA